MNKIIFVILALLITTQSYSQITIGSPSPKIETSSYDSIQNYFTEKTLYNAIGQSVFIRPYPIDFQKYGYRNFFKTPVNTLPDQSNVWNSSGAATTIYDSLAGKTLKITDVIVSDNGYFFELINENDTVYFFDQKLFWPLSINSRKKYGFSRSGSSMGDALYPILIVGYFDKQKEMYLGQEYYCRLNRNWSNYKSGEKIIILPMSHWECVDIVLDGEHFSCLLYIMKNDNEETIALPIDFLDEWFIGKGYGDKLAKKYGPLYEKAMAGTVVIGMPEELVRVALGDPEKINVSSHGPDQWVYDGEYIYLENGKVVAWN